MQQIANYMFIFSQFYLALFFFSWFLEINGKESILLALSTIFLINKARIHYYRPIYNYHSNRYDEELEMLFIIHNYAEIILSTSVVLMIVSFAFPKLVFDY